MNAEVRNVPAANLEDKDSRQWALSNIKESTVAYKLYYYMLTKSAVDWNPDKNGGYHPYYYLTDNKKYWTKKEAAAELECDPRSITNNINRLINNGLIEYDKERKRYRFVSLSYWTPLHWDILKSFMMLGKNANWVIMIRFYSVLAYAFERNIKSFTTTDIIKTLGIGNNNSPFLRMCLQWWQQLGMISVSSKIIRSINFGDYSLYTIDRIETRPNSKVSEMLLSDGPLTESWLKLQTRETKTANLGDEE